MQPARAPCLAVALLSFAVVLSCSTRSGDQIGPELPPSLVGSASTGEQVGFHKLMIALEIGDMQDPIAFDIVSNVFDAFQYGHPMVEESVVQRLRAAGLEDWRYFNVFSVDPRYPEWHGFYEQLWDRLAAIDGLIPGVHYKYFGSPIGYDYIIDHTRSDVTRAVYETIEAWSDSVGASQNFFDMAFDRLADWMILPGEEWPWPPEELNERNTRWRANMQYLIEASSRRKLTAINSSYDLVAPVVFFESQPWNHLRGRYTWQQLLEKITAEDVIPIVHVGHLHLHTPAATAQGEEITAAAWLMVDRAYLRVEFEWEALSFAGRVLERGLNRFAADGPAEEIAPQLWRRTGTIDGVAYEVVIDTDAPQGIIRPIAP